MFQPTKTAGTGDRPLPATSFFGLGLCRLSLGFDRFLRRSNIHLDLLRFRLGSLGQGDRQDAIVVISRDLLRVNCVRKAKAALERSVPALHAMIVLFLGFL